MKKIFNSNIFWMIVSLIAAVVLWVYVSSIESDQYTRTLRGVPVEFVGESILRDKGLVITDLNSNTVTVELTGPRRTIASLASDDVSAQINVSNLTQSAIASMQFSVKYPDGMDSSNISVTRKIPETLTFRVSKLITRTIPVKGSFDGSVAEGFTSEEASFEPSTITVSGAESDLEKIAYAWVSFGENEEISSTFSVESGFVLVDENKEPVDSNNVDCSTEIILAKLPILKVADIPLDVDIIYGAGATEHNTKISIDPKSVKFAGDSNLIDGLSKITLATIDLSSFENIYEESFPIVYDNSLTNIDGTDHAKVSIKINGLSTESFKVSNLSAINATEGYDVKVISKNIEVTLRGTAENLAKIKNEHIRAVVDLKDYDYTIGSALVTPVIYVDDLDGHSVGAVATDKVQVEIVKVG